MSDFITVTSCQNVFYFYEFIIYVLFMTKLKVSKSESKKGLHLDGGGFMSDDDGGTNGVTIIAPSDDDSDIQVPGLQKAIYALVTFYRCFLAGQVFFANIWSQSFLKPRLHEHEKRVRFFASVKKTVRPFFFKTIRFFCCSCKLGFKDMY
jgi:hypothetical protein